MVESADAFGYAWQSCNRTGRSCFPKLVQERLGHSSIAITLDRYSHLFPSAEEALVDALDAAHAAAQAPASNAVPIAGEGRARSVAARSPAEACSSLAANFLGKIKWPLARG